MDLWGMKIISEFYKYIELYFVDLQGSFSIHGAKNIDNFGQFK